MKCVVWQKWGSMYPWYMQLWHFFLMFQHSSYHHLHALTYLYDLSGLILNSISFLWYAIHKGTKPVQRALFLELAICDMLISVYLTIILVANYMHYNDIVYVALAWKASSLVFGIRSVYDDFSYLVKSHNASYINR